MNVARPCVKERTSVEYPNIVASGTSAATACASPRALETEDPTPPRREVPDDGAGESLGRHHLETHDRLDDHRVALRGAPRRPPEKPRSGKPASFESTGWTVAASSVTFVSIIG